MGEPCRALCALRRVEQRVNIGGKPGLRRVSFGDGGNRRRRESRHILNDGREGRDDVMAVGEIW
jgi:hypothetical protein